MSDMAGKAVRVTVERSGKLPRYKRLASLLLASFRSDPVSAPRSQLQASIFRLPAFRPQRFSISAFQFF
jgi:hypothetical protein